MLALGLTSDKVFIGFEGWAWWRHRQMLDQSNHRLWEAIAVLSIFFFCNGVKYTVVPKLVPVCGLSP